LLATSGRTFLALQEEDSPLSPTNFDLLDGMDIAEICDAVSVRGSLS